MIYANVLLIECCSWLMCLCLFVQGVKEVEETWQSMKFIVVKYTKGTSDRGYILGAVDEILQMLDDNAMNLQSMSASRFIGPFMNAVQNWEKSLSLISEVLDVSCLLFHVYHLVLPVFLPIYLLSYKKLVRFIMYMIVDKGELFVY